MNRQGLWKKHFLVLLLISLLCVSFGGCGQEKTPEAQALKAIKSGDYDEALSIIGENEMVVQDEAVISQLETRIAELQSAYENESMKYDDVAEELSAIARLNVPNVWTELQEVYEYVESLYLERNFQKVWLCASTVTESNGSTTKTTWDYDDAGRLIGYSVKTTHLNTGNTVVDYFMSYTYEYNDDGEIFGVVISDGKDQYRVEAVYSNNRLVEYVGKEGEENGRISFEYDAEGNVVAKNMDYDGDRYTLVELSYYQNGGVKERRRFDDPYLSIYKYDENGRLIENSIIRDNECVMRSITEYNVDGQLSYQATYEWSAAVPSTETTYEYDAEGRISVVKGQSEGKEFYSKGDWAPSGDSVSFLNWAGFLVKQRFDEAGNCTSIAQYDTNSFEEVYEQKSTYIMLYLPFDYEKPDLNDPRYLVN